MTTRNMTMELYHKIEKSFKKMPSVVFQDTPKVIILFIVNNKSFSKQHPKLVIDIRSALKPRIFTSYEKEEAFNIASASHRIAFEFEDEDIFINAFKDNNFQSGLENGKIRIQGEENMLRKIGPLLSELIRKETKNASSVDKAKTHRGVKNCIVSDIIRRKQIIFYRLTSPPPISGDNNGSASKSNNLLLQFDIERRFSEFVHLNEELRQSGINSLPKLPQKSINIFRNSQKFLTERRVALEEYINALFDIPSAIDFLHIFLNITTTAAAARRLTQLDATELDVHDKFKRRLHRKLSYHGTILQTETNDKQFNANSTFGNINDSLSEQQILLLKLQSEVDKHQSKLKSVDHGSAVLHAQFLKWVGPAVLDMSFWAGFTYLGYNLISAATIYLFKTISSKIRLYQAKQQLVRLSIVMLVSYLVRWRIVSWSNANVYKRQFKFIYVALCILFGYKIARRQTTGMNQEEKDAFYLYVNKRFAILSYLCMAELGGMVMKAGQYMGARSDVTPAVFVEALEKLQDQVPSRDFREVKHQISKALGPVKFGDTFIEFEEVPIAAASIAQVHKARLKTGTTSNSMVAVKVQHVGIESVMRADIQALDWVTRLIAWSEPEYNFEPIMTEWKNEAIKELDFCREHENVNIVASGLNNNADFNVWVPTTIGQFKPAKEMMVLEFASNAVKVTDVDVLNKHNVNFDQLLDDITKAFAHQMFHIGVFSGDPHPGNILVELPSPSNGGQARAVLLDFGLAKRLSNRMRLAFAKLVIASAEKDYFMLLESFDEMGLKLNRLDSEEDVDTMRFLFRDTAPPKEARSQLKKYDKARKKKMKARRARKIVKPVDAFPGDLLFFLRAQDLLRGLCSTLNVRQSPLKIFNASSKKAIELASGKSNGVQLVNYIKNRENTMIKNKENNHTLERKLNFVLNHLEITNKIIGCQVAVTQNDKLVADVCAGVQENNPSNKCFRAVTPHSMFNCFSVTKAITVTAVHMLVDQGKINYEEKVGAYWPEFGVKHPTMTVREMISHRARMQHAMPKDVTFQNFCDLRYMSDAMCDIESDSFDGELDDPNKMQYHYLSFGWLVAGLVSAVTNMSFQDFVLENILRRINIDHEARIGIPKEWLEYNSIHYSRFCKLDASVFIERATSDNNGINDDDDINLGVSAEEMDKLTARMEERVKDLAADTDGNDGNSHETEKGKKKGKKKESMQQIIASFKKKPFLYDVRCYNSKAVRQACIPAANGHFTARALAIFYSKLYNTTQLISSEAVRKEMIKPIVYEHVRSGGENGDFVKAEWAYGYKLYPFHVKGGGKLNGFGHTGAGGSIALCIPHCNVTLAIAINKMTSKPHEIWKPIFEAVDDVLGIGKAIALYDDTRLEAQ